MNVYKMKGQAEGGAVKVEMKELKIDPRPAPPYRARVKMADKETQVTPERDSVSSLPSFKHTICQDCQTQFLPEPCEHFLILYHKKDRLKKV